LDLPVEVESVQAAIELGTYFKVQAIRTFGTMSADADQENASYVLDRIVRTGRSELTERDIYNETRPRFPTVKDLRPAIAHLIDHGFLAQAAAPAIPRPGRKPSPTFAVHPRAADYTADRAQYAQS
jgi:hypothetical protein